MPPVPRPTPRGGPRAAATGATESTGSAGRDTPTKRGTVDKKLVTNITDTYTMLGMMVSGAGLARGDEGLVGSGQSLVNRADRFGEAWLGLANRNPKVKAALVRFTEGTATAEILVLHVAVLMPLLASRGVVPVPMAMAVDAMVDQDVPPDPSTVVPAPAPEEPVPA